MEDERDRQRLPLPERHLDRLLLGLGATALLTLIPAAWIWILDAAALNPAVVYAAGPSLSGLALVIGLAMIRILDQR